jgi:hypothetical protein
MKITAAFLLILLLVSPSIAGVPLPIRDTGLTCEVILWRSGLNGRANEAVTNVNLKNSKTGEINRLVLAGGQATGVFLEPGTYEYSADSLDPYLGLDDKKREWKSPLYQLTISDGDAVILEMVPKTRKAANIGPWQIKAIKRWNNKK